MIYQAKVAEEKIKELEVKILEQKKRKAPAKFLSTLLKEKKAYERKLLQLKGVDGEIYVTDHAVLRYIERVVGIDIENMKKMMVPEHVRKNINQFGDGYYQVENGRNFNTY